MKLSPQLQFILACGISCGCLGCKSPMAWFSKPTTLATTAPDVQYNGISGFSSTVKQNANAEVVSGGQPPGTMAKAWESTTGAVTSLLGTSPKLDADIYLRAAHFAEQGGKFKEAEAKYQQALKVEPKNVDAILGLARLYDQQGNSQQAVTTYQKALQLHPKNATVYNDLGLCYGRRRELAPAQQMLQKAVELEPGRANYRMNLATVLVDMGRPAEAFQQLAAAQPQGVAHYNLACLLEERGQHDQAVDQARLALTKDPSLAPAREFLAQFDGAPQQNMQTVSTTVPSRDPRSDRQQRQDDARARSRQGNPAMQMDQQDLQPPVINYGPATPENSQRPVYWNQEDSAPQPQQQYPARRSSYDDVSEDDKDEESTPATVRISDDE